MNGCMYEPVQDPTSQQGFNRYAYCFYNPLKYVDPTGERCYGPSEAEIVQMAINEARQRCWGETYRMLEEQQFVYQQIKDGQHPFGWGGSGGGGSAYNSGGFYNSNGRYIGNNGRNDGKIYIITDFNMSASLYKETLKFIRTNSGNSNAFTEDCIAYSNSVEIPVYENRQAMWEIVSQDNGMGGTSDCNNREYGGYIDVDGVHCVLPGCVGNPKENPVIDIELPNGYSRFHSHPSGYSKYFGTETGVAEWLPREPSPTDIKNAGMNGNDKFTHYVFSRANNCVYIYNYSGIQAVMKTDKFLKLRP